MQETVYKCDQCKIIIGEKKHISASFSNYSGIATPTIEDITMYEINGRKARWSVKKSLQGKFLHFCNGKCIGEYFKKLMQEKDEKSRPKRK